MSVEAPIEPNARSGEPADAATASPRPSSQSATRLVLECVRPYGGWLFLVFLAMLVETGANLAAPWPLKIVIDSALGTHRLPTSLAWLGDSSLARSATGLAALAAAWTVVIAALGGVAGYIDSYYTESVGQWIANDLRMKVYHHLLRLSLTYYDTHQTSTMLSTITDDVSTIQDFASSATLGIVIDLRRSAPSGPIAHV